MTREGVIGRQGDLPWRLSADLRRFKSLTMGHAIIMGRRTYESIGRLLPGRTTIVVTRQADYRVDGALMAHDLDHAFRAAAESDGGDECFIIGGGELYASALPRVNRLYVTWVETEVDGDTYFPAWRESDWRQVQEESLPIDDKNEYPTTFAVYERR